MKERKIKKEKTKNVKSIISDLVNLNSIVSNHRAANYLSVFLLRLVQCRLREFHLTNFHCLTNKTRKKINIEEINTDKRQYQISKEMNKW